MSENQVKDQIKLLSQEYKLALFSNPVGTGWVGKFIGFDGSTALILGGHRISFGLHEGSPDQCGWLPVKITPEMVGKTVAVFVGFEAKDGRNKPELEQVQFIDRLIADGAIAGVCYSGEDARKVIRAWFERTGANLEDVKQTLKRNKRK